MSFSISTYCVDAILVVVLAGVVDFARAWDFQDHLLAALGGHRWTTRVIVDVSGLDWIHPEGIGAIVAAFWRATNCGKDFGLVASQDGVRDTLLLARLDWFAPIYPTVQAAVHSGVTEA